MSPTLNLVMDALMSTADQLKVQLAILSDQIDAELAAHLADASAATAATDANEQALVDALALVGALSAKLPPLPAMDPNI